MLVGSKGCVRERFQSPPQCDGEIQEGEIVSDGGRLGKYFLENHTFTIQKNKPTKKKNGTASSFSWVFVFRPKVRRTRRTGQAYCTVAAPS